MATTHIEEVRVPPIDAARLEPLIGIERMARYESTAELAQRALAGRTVFNINSTAAGGGVAEMLQTLLAYARGAGVDARWMVIQGDPSFFDITKRIHNGLYGDRGDGGPLGARERRHYETVLRRNAEELRAIIRPGDLVLLHDPQPAGLAAALRGFGARVVWRCHVGSDEPNAWTARAWEFIRPYVEDADAYVFSRAAFAPPWADPQRTYVIPPSIDPFSAKNEPMARRNVRLVLQHTGLLLDGDKEPPLTPFRRRDGSPGRVDRHADVVQSGPATPPDVPLVVQVSRWDSQKDMAGVMHAFAEHVDPTLGAHLVLAGPAVRGVADDPEAAAVWEDCVEQWRALPHAARGTVHLACIPMADPDENAAIVNALQRHAAIVVQKSLAEGFGLTVAEAMWKARPVVASAVGGIVDQIHDGEDGLLLQDPHDLAACGELITGLLHDRARAEALGAKGRERVNRDVLGDRHLEQYAELFGRLAGERSVSPPAPAPAGPSD